jgi:hypothetical protein
MSVFDDPKMSLEVGGIEVAPSDVEDHLAEEDLVSPSKVSWAVVDRWCRDHPGRIRLIPGTYAQVTTSLRKRYPQLTVRATKHRKVPGRSGARCDVLVVFVAPGEPSPFDDEIPGIPLRVTKTTGRLDAPRT